MDRCKMASKGRKNKEEMLKFSFEAPLELLLDMTKCRRAAVTHEGFGCGQGDCLKRRFTHVACYVHGRG